MKILICGIICFILIIIWIILEHYKDYNKLPKWKYISFDDIKVGDKIRVNVGFNCHKTEGIVSAIYRESGYLWFSSSIHYSTASESYGNFEIFK